MPRQYGRRHLAKCINAGMPLSRAWRSHCVQALGFDHILRVVDKFLIELEMLLHEKQVSLSATPAARDWLAQHGFDPLMGARPMARLSQDKIKRPLADELLFGKLVAGGRVSLDAADGELALDVQAEPEKLLPAVVE